MRRAVGRWAKAGIVLLAALAVWLGWTSRTRDAASSATKPVVAFVGDSNETLAMPSVYEVLAPDFKTVDASLPGSGIRGVLCGTDPCRPDLWQNRLPLAGASAADVYVVDLGINDSSSAGTTVTLGYAHYDDKVDWLMRLLGNKPVLWTNLPCGLEPEYLLKGCTLVNQTLTRAASRWPNLTVLDWETFATSHRSWVGDFGGIHLTAEGQQAWADFVNEALHQRFVG